MPILGSHLSISGGYYKAVEAAAAVGCDCVQLFTKNNNQWRAKPITAQDIDQFQNKLAELGMIKPLSHASYLINLASPNDELYRKSIDGMIVELERANQLGIPYVVLHPGSFTTSDEETGLNRIIGALNQIHCRTEKLHTTALLENTAGQGSNLGWDFRHLGAIIRGVDEPDRLGVCIDTCHAFAAGYAMDTPDSYEATIKKMKTAFGIRKIRAFHLNDSKKPLGSRKDRHEHIGQGEMGLEPFRLLLNDRRFAKIPMYLETEKGERNGENLDVMNLKTLRNLIR